MKKSIALLLALTFFMSLSGCGGITAPGMTTEPFLYEPAQSAPSTSPEPMTEPSTEPPTEPPTEPVPSIVQPEPEDSAFVPVLDYIPDLMVELRYATEENFTGTVIYDQSHAYLRYGTVKKLLMVQETLRDQGLGLKLWDGFRPVSSQFVLWEVFPDPTFVADPRKGFSSHSRGNTVDVTLVDVFGNELSMPTGFDDFSAMADRDYSDCPEEAAGNALLLQTLMEQAGFSGYYGEWWHFSDKVSYPVEEQFTPVPQHTRFALCEEFITLREWADTAAPEILKIPAGSSFTVLAEHGAFLMVSYRGLRGYVLESYTQR